ncbi:MAG: A/G-specific adenine glycosylase [Lentisphaeria bacterium]|nr:A/G-specific adenine glycosylase [Lentisphaeria bacterium]
MTEDHRMPPETRQLLAWYAVNGRDLPWRVRGGPHPDPYAVWVSEIMLQQTTVKTVLDYFPRWMERFPTLKSLAESPLDDVLKTWQGLGYYARARKMHECARHVMDHCGGVFPRQREKLLKLPGIGPYTASSLCAFAFDLPETVVDGNVIRVLARLRGLTGEADRNVIYPLAAELTPRTCGADYASAVMDLGATVCKASSPLCGECPWRESCVARREGIQNRIPVLKRPEKKKKCGAVFILENARGELFIRRRPGRGLLAGLWELPWSDDGTFPFSADWRRMPLSVRHVFTHFDLTLAFYRCDPPFPGDLTGTGVFVTERDQEKYAFSTLMKKVLKELGRAG